MGEDIAAMNSVPDGCFAFPVGDDDTAPIFRCGDFAVVDPTDRDPEFGRLYLIEYPPSGIRSEPLRRIVQVCRFGEETLLDRIDPAYHVGSYRGQHVPGMGEVRMLDGAYSKANLRKRLLGAIAGRLAWT